MKFPSLLTLFCNPYAHTGWWRARVAAMPPDAMACLSFLMPVI
jgi:hypothetical protein